jgi:branched-chain amino acid transport system permease protein
VVADAIQVTVNGLSVGLSYALILFGILLAFHVSRIVNFAHGQFGMLAGLVSFLLADQFGLPLWVSIAAGIGVAGLTALVMERLLVERIPLNTEGADIVATLGVFLLLAAFAENVLHEGRARRYPRLTEETFTFGGAFVDGNVLISLLLVTVIFAVSAFILRRTRAGSVVRATAENPLIAETLGWNVKHIRTLVWTIAGLLGGVAGIIVAVRIPVSSEYMDNVVIKAFIAGILGGLHRYAAPLAIAVFLGLAENWIGYVFGAEYRTPGIFGLAIIAMVIAPKWLLAGRIEARG